MPRALPAVAMIFLVASNAMALGYREAKAECLKEKPELKGKILRTCIKEKEAAANGETNAAKSGKAAAEVTDTESAPN